MSSVETPFLPALVAVQETSALLPVEVRAVRELDDDALLEAQRALADIRRSVDACSALLAGEIGARSRREFGYTGLAQREGFRSPEALLQHATGASARDATALVRVGALVHEALSVDGESGAADAAMPWSRVIGRAVNNRSISVAAADAIRSGLGSPASDADAGGVTAEQLEKAAEALVSEAADLDVDALLRRAREVRDGLDASGIAQRECAIQEERGIRRVRRSSGVSRYIVDPDLESGAFWDDLYDCLTSPRRGGVRFVDEAQKQWAENVATDPRTIEQYVHDSITELLRIGSTLDDTASRRIVGGRAPAVRVLTTDSAIASRIGHGRIEGSQTPVSIETVERIACTAGTIELRFDRDGRVLDLGRERRLFSSHQRIALAARDGGCRFPDCARPPSWTEAHHVKHWKRDRGTTDIADGLLLCRFHHMLLHNNHWEIERHGSDYWLLPPPDVDPRRTPRAMPSKSAALRDPQALEHAG